MEKCVNRDKTDIASKQRKSCQAMTKSFTFVIWSNLSRLDMINLLYMTSNFVKWCKIVCHMEQFWFTWQAKLSWGAKLLHRQCLRHLRQILCMLWISFILIFHTFYFESHTSGIITCCYENHSCVQDWTTMQHRVYTTAKWANIRAHISAIKFEFWSKTLLALLPLDTTWLISHKTKSSRKVWFKWVNIYQCKFAWLNLATCGDWV